jgi:hypothetical protein
MMAFEHHYFTKPSEWMKRDSGRKQMMLSQKRIGQPGLLRKEHCTCWGVLCSVMVTVVTAIMTLTTTRTVFLSSLCIQGLTQETHRTEDCDEQHQLDGVTKHRLWEILKAEAELVNEIHINGNKNSSESARRSS